MIRYKCEKCGSVLKIKDRLAGTKGKCPKCETAFKVPDAPSGDAADGAAEEQDVSEEDAIFGKDFFTLQETPKGPRQPIPVASPSAVDSDPDDDFAGDDLPPAGNPQPFSAARPSSTDNSSNIAGQLLSKTGKKNRPDDWQDPEEEEGGYDVSADSISCALPDCSAGVLSESCFPGVAMPCSAICSAMNSSVHRSRKSAAS